MLAHGSQLPIPVSRRLPGAALLAVALTVGACGGDNPLAPADQGAPADQPASSDAAGALVTAQRIVFTSYRNGQYDIYKMDPAGQNVVRLTSMSTEESEPAWSPDNKRVADRIIVLDCGRIVEEGTHAELLSREGRYASHCELQLTTD